MIRRRGAAAALALVAVAVAVSLTGPGPGTAAASPSDRGATLQSVPAAPDLLSIDFVSPWVAPDGTFEVRFAPATGVPADSELRVTIHQPLGRGSGLRAAVARVADGGSPGGVVQGPIDLPAPLFGDPAAGWRLPLPIRSGPGDPQRVLVPRDGIHPVTLELVAAGGTRLWSSTVFLNRLPAEPSTGVDGRRATMAVSLVVPLDSPPTLTPTGAPALQADTLVSVAELTKLLDAVPEAPLTLGMRPNTLTGAVGSDSGGSGLLDALRSPRLRAAAVRRPDVNVDVGGLIDANALDVLDDELTIGSSVLSDLTTTTPVTSTWLLDDTITPESLPVLEALGTSRVILPVERLELPDGTAPAIARTRTMRLSAAGNDPANGDEGSNLTAIADDPGLTLRLIDPKLDPGTAANRVLTELTASWFAAIDEGAEAFPGPQAAIVVPPQIDPAVVRALVPGLIGEGPLQADPRATPPPAGNVDGSRVTATLQPRTPDDPRAAVDGFRSSRATIIGVRSITGLGEPSVQSWDLLNAQSMARDLDPAAREATHGFIADDSARLLANIELPSDRKIVLTSEDATIPLRFRNNLSYPVEVLLRLRSSRLDFPDGDERTIRLDPGENLVELRVTSRAPGDSIVRIDVASPDATVGVGSVQIPVTSSTISGVGAALSIISLLVLGWWWLATVRRRNRRSARRGGAHPTSRTGDHPDGVPAEPAASPDTAGSELIDRADRDDESDSIDDTDGSERS